MSATFRLRRSRSPTTLKDMISSTSARPGNTAIQYSPDSRNSKPLAISSPSEGSVIGTPTPRKDSVASSVIAPAMLMVATTSTEPIAVGQQVPQHDAPGRQAEIHRRLDVFLAPLDQRGGAHQPRVLRPLHQHDREDHLVHPAPERGQQHQRHQDRRKAEDEVDDAHEHRVDAPPNYAATRPDEAADQQWPRHGGREPHGQAGAQPVEDGAEHVAALRVGAQPVGEAGHAFGARRQPVVHDVERGEVVRVLRREEGGQHDDQQQHDERNHRALTDGRPRSCWRMARRRGVSVSGVADVAGVAGAADARVWGEIQGCAWLAVPAFIRIPAAARAGRAPHTACPPAG